MASEVDRLLHVDDDWRDEPRPVARGWTVGGVLMNLMINLFVFPLTLLLSFFTVAPQEEVLILIWGRLVSIKKEPGLKWYNLVGRSLIRISTRLRTIDIKKTTVVDANGNPIIVSGVVTFKVVDSVKAAFDVENVQDYMERQAMATLKKVCSRYPYESKVSQSFNQDGISLQTEAGVVAQEMVKALQEKANFCGVRVYSYELADLQYAPEIAQGMLIRQQAQALLDSRKIIVEGATSIVTQAMFSLAQNGIKLGDKEQTRLVSNLLAVLCSESRVQPMFSISENVESSSATTQELLGQVVKQLQSLHSVMVPKH